MILPFLDAEVTLELQEAKSPVDEDEAIHHPGGSTHPVEPVEPVSARLGDHSSSTVPIIIPVTEADTPAFSSPPCSLAGRGVP
ncbi:hypothetical protein FHL15_001436 [Xylaria flabelliformis]|uniref:Uncharacterized protein n=1 Tax=Xylaria flabelliformis TaxID=2512241 RepID=A0A553IBU8_9PEZI|nr:hypothetical protein FHL15_001436 [Xylaria flabelliformis]